MRGAGYDVFISYRRRQNADLAQLVRNALTAGGLRVFLDVRELGAGQFDQALLTEIARAPHFLLLLTPGTLDACGDPSDWLTREVAHAIATKRNIIPVTTPDFEFLPASLPERLAPLAGFQAALYDHRFSDESIARLLGMLRRRQSRLPLAIGAAAVALVLGSALGWHWLGSTAGSPTSNPLASGADLSASESRLTRAASLKAGEAAVGVTLYRLRPARTEDDQNVRLLVQETGAAAEWLPVRIATGEPLADGERVRLAIESGRAGYLYVVDEEQFSGGGSGDPYLIFPTTRTRAGRNAIVPGQLVEIPAWEDTPPFFRLRRSRSDSVGERLTLIVSPEVLAEVTIGSEAIKLAPDWMSRWRTLAAGAESIHLPGAVGSPYTLAEREAAAERPRLLAQNAPLPQTTYRLRVGPNEPLVVNVGLRIR